MVGRNHLLITNSSDAAGGKYLSENPHPTLNDLAELIFLIRQLLQLNGEPDKPHFVLVFVSNITSITLEMVDTELVTGHSNGKCNEAGQAAGILAIFIFHCVSQHPNDT